MTLSFKFVRLEEHTDEFGEDVPMEQFRKLPMNADETSYKLNPYCTVGF